jgi:transcriptional regulator with XRE-family HTH domain
MSALGERIKAARLHYGLTEQQLAADCNVDKVTVLSWEGGLRDPDPAMLDKLADIFQVDSQWFDPSTGPTGWETPTWQAAVDTLESEFHDLLQSQSQIATDQIASEPASTPRTSASDTLQKTHNSKPVKKSRNKRREAAQLKRAAVRAEAKEHARLITPVLLIEKINTTITKHLPDLTTRQTRLRNIDVSGKPQDDAWTNEIRYFIHNAIVPSLTQKEWHALAPERDNLVEIIAQKVQEASAKLGPRVNFVLVGGPPATKLSQESTSITSVTSAPSKVSQETKPSDTKIPSERNSPSAHKVNFVLVNEPPAIKLSQESTNITSITPAQSNIWQEAKPSDTKIPSERNPPGANKVNFVPVDKFFTTRLHSAASYAEKARSADREPSPGPPPPNTKAPDKKAPEKLPDNPPKTDHKTDKSLKTNVRQSYLSLIDAHPVGFKLFAFPWFGCLAVGAFLYSMQFYSIWSNIIIEPQLATAREYVRTDEPEQALPITLKLLKKYPADAGLLYFVSGLYLELDRPVVANFYLSALKRSETFTSLSQKQQYKVDQLLLSDSPDLIKRDIQETAHLADRLPETWKTTSYTRSANPILNTRAEDVTPAMGYTNPEFPISCEDGRKLCGFDFRDSNGIWNAIVTQTMTIKDQRGGNDCCTLQLDDPDLRSVDSGYLELLQHQHLGADSKYDVNRILTFRSHILIKQLYALHFADYANSKNMPRIFANISLDNLQFILFMTLLAISVFPSVLLFGAICRFCIFLKRKWKHA